MPKRGVSVRTIRRSISSFWPVISACSGADNPSVEASVGTSCTRPSVIKTAPATRSGGTSASVDDSAENSLVPSVSPSAAPASATRTQQYRGDHQGDDKRDPDQVGRHQRSK